MHFIIWRLIVLFHFIKYVHLQSSLDVNKLYNVLFANYKKEIVPVKDHSQPIEIGLTFYLMAINSFHVVEETLSLNGGIVMNWSDTSLSWNSTEYGHKSFIEIPSTVIWVPWIYLINNAKTLRPIGSDSLFQATVFENGSVVFSPGDVLDVECKTDVSKFPFDTQTCELEFHAQHVWSSGRESCKLSTSSDKILMDYFVENSNWEVTDTHTFTKHHYGGFESFHVKILLDRKPGYDTVMTIIPTLLLCLLNPVVFLLPVVTGERISLAMTILLSYAVFLSLVAASIPASSSPMCYLLITMILITSISGIVVIFAIISNRYYYKMSYQPGKLATCLISCFIGTKVSECETVKQEVITSAGRQFSGVLDKVFLVISYILIAVVVFTYLIYVLF